MIDTFSGKKQTPFPGGAGWPKFNQLQIQTKFGEDRCTQFRVIVVTDPQTDTQTDWGDYSTLHAPQLSAQCKHQCANWWVFSDVWRPEVMVLRLWTVAVCHCVCMCVCVCVCVLQGVITVERPLDQLESYTATVQATDNWNGTTGIRRISLIPVRYTRALRLNSI